MVLVTVVVAVVAVVDLGANLAGGNFTVWTFAYVAAGANQREDFRPLAFGGRR